MEFIKRAKFDAWKELAGLSQTKRRKVYRFRRRPKPPTRNSRPFPANPRRVTSAFNDTPREIPCMFLRAGAGLCGYPVKGVCFSTPDRCAGFRGRISYAFRVEGVRRHDGSTECWCPYSMSPRGFCRVRRHSNQFAMWLPSGWAVNVPASISCPFSPPSPEYVICSRSRVPYRPWQLYRLPAPLVRLMDQSKRKPSG